MRVHRENEVWALLLPIRCSHRSDGLHVIGCGIESAGIDGTKCRGVVERDIGQMVSHIERQWLELDGLVARRVDQMLVLDSNDGPRKATVPPQTLVS